MKPLPTGIADVFCPIANKRVPLEEAPEYSTALALCSYCGQSIHYNNHKFQFSK